MRTIFNVLLIAVIALATIMWFLGIWGFLGREIQIYCAIEGTLALVFVMVRFRKFVWNLMTNKEI